MELDRRHLAAKTVIVKYLNLMEEQKFPGYACGCVRQYLVFDNLLSDNGRNLAGCKRFLCMKHSTLSDFIVNRDIIVNLVKIDERWIFSHEAGSWRLHICQPLRLR